jgi:CheY-like chemotaxis protein
MHILVVDDIAINRKLIECLLKGYPCSLYFATDGFTALEAIRNQPMDLVLMDIQMPILSGFQTTQAIRFLEAELGRSTHTPVIAVTAFFDEQECLKCGMNGYVDKPVSRNSLVALLERYAPVNSVS